MKGLTFIVKVLLIFTLLLIVTSCTSTKPISNTVAEPTKESIDMLNEVSALMNSLKFNEARKLLEDNYNLIKDVDMGLNGYGFLEFHVFRNYEKGEELYKRAIELNPENSEHYKALGDLYQAEGEYKKAIKYYDKAAEKTVNYNNVPLNPKLSILYKNIGESYLKQKNTKKAIEALEKATANNPFSIAGNAILHKLYVEKEEYEKAYNVWRNDNLIDESGDHVYKGLLEWNKKYQDAIKDKNRITHLEMANLYSHLVLLDEAAIEYDKAYAEEQKNEDIKNKLYEMKSFLSFRDELETLLDDYYRARSINSKEEATFYTRIKPAYEKIAPLFPHVKEKNERVSAWIETLNKEIEKKFNVRIENIKANGSMLGLHFGRIIDRSSIHSTLWGSEADLKVITLKNMTSNGLNDWLSMGNSGVGGWSISASEIVRVIQDTKNDNGLQLASIYNQDAREEFKKRFGNIKLDKEERGPLELFYSSNIHSEFTTRQIDIEVEKARAKGIADTELQKYLFDKIEKDFAIKTTIFTHESQHSIDNKNRFIPKWFGENEYRPKLSELAYGNMPFLGLFQFYSSTIGMEIHDTHNSANNQIFKDIIQYIHDNSIKFPQVDTKKNILAQLHKLSEGDIKGIAIEIFQSKYGVKYE